jgi:excisionase family DNA binding protein
MCKEMSLVLGDLQMQQAVPENDGLLVDGLLTVNEAAEFLRASRSHLYNLMEAGELCYVKIGKCRRIPRRSLLLLASRNLVVR